MEGSEFSRQQLLPGAGLTVVPVLDSDLRDVPDAAVQPGLVNQLTQFRVASSRSSTPRQGPSWRVHPVL